MLRACIALLAASANGATMDPRFLQTALSGGKSQQQNPETEAALSENLRAQERNLNFKKRISSTEDIDEQERRMANETGSPALAAMLGNMYKDMRMFNKPRFEKHLSAHQAKLQEKEASLRAQLDKEDDEDGDAKEVKAQAADVKEEKEEKDEDEEEEEEPAAVPVAAEKKVKSDYNDETEFHEAIPGIWPAKSQFPVTVEYFIAITWVLFVASVPFMLARVTGKAQTAIDRTLTVTLLIVLFGGLYLFTNIILFQSAHFETHRPLTLVECVYMMSQVITTVGYGDVTPAKQRGQVFVGFYVITSFLVIAVMMSNLVSHLIQAAKVRFEGDDVKNSARSKEPVTAWMRTKEFISYRNLRFQLLVYLFFAATWSLFFANMPGEGKKWYEAVYMSIITLSTVGFGAFTASTEAGKVFAAFWMIFGSLALVGAIGEFTNVMSKERENEDFHSEINKVNIGKYEQDTGRNYMTEADFIEFYMLNRKLTSKEELEAYRGAFRTLCHGARMGQSVSASEVAQIVETSVSYENVRKNK